MLGSAGVGPRAVPRPDRRGRPRLRAPIDDVDHLHERAREAGAEVALELIDTDYGSRDFTLRDPEGTLWAFGTYRPAPD